MKVKQLALILCLLVFVTVALFIYFFNKKRSPLDDLPVFASTREITKLSLLYSFGNGDSKEDNLKQPIKIVVDALGQAFVLDNGDNHIKVYDPNGKFVTSFGVADSGQKDELQAPAGIALYDGILLVSDPTAGRIQAYTKKGSFVRTFFTSPANEKYSPVGMVDAGNKHLLFTDVAGHRVVELDGKGAVVSSFGSPGSKDGHFAYPNDIVMDSKKRLYVADSNNGRVQVFDRDGKYLLKIDGTNGEKPRMALPKGLAIDPYNHLLVADTLSNQIRVFELTGESIFEYGELGEKDGEFSFPSGVAADRTKILVADRENNRVEVLNASK